MLIQHKVFHFYLTLFLVVFICFIWSENACLRILWGPILWEHFQIFDHDVSQTGCLTWMCVCLCTRVAVCLYPLIEVCTPICFWWCTFPLLPVDIQITPACKLNLARKNKNGVSSRQEGMKMYLKCCSFFFCFSDGLCRFTGQQIQRRCWNQRTKPSRDSAVCRSCCIRKERYCTERFMEEKGVEGRTN